MKRYILFWLMAVGTLLTAAADNVLTLSSVQGHPGEEVEVAVTLQHTDSVTALEMQLPLPDALRYAEGSAVLTDTRSNGHALSAAEKDGVLTLFLYSMALTPLKGNDGEVFRFRLRLGKVPADYNLSPTAMLSDAAGNALPCSVTSGTVTLLSPQIEVLTPMVDYGRVPIRSTHRRTFRLRNAGNEPLTISGATCSNADFTALPENCTVAPGATQEIQLDYLPLQRGIVEANLTLTTNATNAKAGKVSLKALPFSVNELHVLGAEGISDQEVTVTLKMNNMEPIAGAQCSFMLPDALVYVEGSAQVGERCQETNHVVLGQVQGKELSFLLYSPTNAVMPEGDGTLLTFRLRLNGKRGTYALNPQEVLLGNASMENMTSATTSANVLIKAPSLSSDATLQFAPTPPAHTAKVAYVVRNYGNADLKIERVNFLAEGYGIEEALPLTVAPNRSATLTVTCLQETEGMHSTKMLLYTNDPDNRVKTVDVSGRICELNYLRLSAENSEEGYRLTVSLDNQSQIAAVQLNVQWQKGMVTSADAMQLSERLSGHAHAVTDMGNGVYQVLVYSLNNTPISGNEGELFTLDYVSDGKTDYVNTEVRLTDIVLSDVNGRNRVVEEEVTVMPQITHYRLRFVVEGEVLYEKMIKAGTPLEMPELQLEEREGYTFEWGDLPRVMPSGDVTITGKYIATHYWLRFEVENRIVHEEFVKAGTPVVMPDFEIEEREGYTFKWTNLPSVMPYQDVTVVGMYLSLSGIYQLKYPGDLIVFAKGICDGSISSDTKAMLFADLDMDGYSAEFVPIGNQTYPYCGEFDGGGYTISNLHVSGGDYTGLFGVVKGNVYIHDLTLDQSCRISGEDYVAFVGGSNDSGTVTLEQVGNEADVTGTGMNVAGLIGVNMNSSATFVLRNCYNTGRISGNRESAGLSGWLGDNATVENCYNIGIVEGVEGNYTFARYGYNPTFINCYELNSRQTVDVISVNAVAVSSGELCYRLCHGNTPTGVWRQNLGADNYPVLLSSHAEVLLKGGTYTNIMLLPGDVNSDGTVNVTDFTALANYILGNTPVSFDPKAADLNGDGNINVTDLIAVANMILSGDVSARVKPQRTYDIELGTMEKK